MPYGGHFEKMPRCVRATNPQFAQIFDFRQLVFLIVTSDTISAIFLYSDLIRMTCIEIGHFTRKVVRIIAE
ncbi:protein of unknown function [Paraburkholderia dioscoreae]|uniref:Uncharacterized protein n=1 Tax=Paraburkholderia dioscoreae TaxID=2604047 RepID=A0A5Q4ZDB6_9BURK|nr:protein of unknown function [Paraburkholderia dioscoreae]